MILPRFNAIVMDVDGTKTAIGCSDQGMVVEFFLGTGGGLPQAVAL